MRRASQVFHCIVISALGALHPAGAQDELRIDQDLSFDRTESWAMKYFASVNLFTGLGVPREMEPGSLELGLELDLVPSLSEAQRTVGFNGTKTEDLNRLPVFGRPRIEIGLPKKFSVALSWVPPIEVNGVEPNLWSVAIGRPVADTPRWRLGLRLFGQYGTLDGDFTCPKAEAAAGDNPALNPFRCEEPSSDSMTIRSASFEFSAARKIGRDQRWEPYVSIAINSMNLDFQVNARYNNIIDHTKLLTDGETWYTTVGFQYVGWKRSRIGVEVFYTQLDVIRPPSEESQNDGLFNARAMYSYKLR